MPADLNSKGFRKKMANLKNLDMMFKQLPAHTAHWLAGELRETELNYGMGGDNKHIGRPSGELAKSTQSIDNRAYEGWVIMNKTGSAPYAKKVSLWALGRYGVTPMQHMIDRTKSDMMELIEEEWERAATVINRNGNYTYRNPFYE